MINRLIVYLRWNIKIRSVIAWLLPLALVSFLILALVAAYQVDDLLRREFYKSIAIVVLLCVFRQLSHQLQNQNK